MQCLDVSDISNKNKKSIDTIIAYTGGLLITISNEKLFLAKKTPSVNSLNSRLKEMKKLSNFVKIVTVAKSISDTSRILSLYNKSSKTKLIAFAMGEQAKFSRILCIHLGSPYTYVSLGKAVAPGQFSLDDMKSLQ